MTWVEGEPDCGVRECVGGREPNGILPLSCIFELLILLLSHVNGTRMVPFQRGDVEFAQVESLLAFGGVELRILAAVDRGRKADGC